uniref:Uncharacterized protein n=1 Tax=Panagrolaimus davidi TaxID=227884 RepID=A0A914Q3F3_9BILA
MKLDLFLFFVNLISFIYGCFPNPNSPDGVCPTMVTGPMTDPDCDLTISCNACPAVPSYDIANSGGSCMQMTSMCTMNNMVTIQCGPPCQIDIEQSDGTIVNTMMPMKPLTCDASGKYLTPGATDVVRFRCN